MGNKFVKVFLLAIALGLLVFFSAAPAARPGRSALLRAIAPIFSVTSQGAAAIRDWFLGFSRGEFRSLAEERARLLSRVAELEAVSRENETLRAALALRNDGEDGAIPAESLAFYREGQDEYLLLNRGTADGVGIGDIVVNKERVLGGVVVAVDAKNARAILFSSPSRTIDVLLPERGLRAIARGANARELAIELVPSDADVKKGGLVLASPRATGGRRALLLGEVREARQAEHEIFKSVRALHLFDPAESSVIILLAP